MVYFVTGQMVGDRRSPGATILWVETIYLLSQPSLFSPADMSRTSWWIFLPVHRDGFFCVLGLRFALPCGVAASLWPAVAAAAICLNKDVAASMLPTVAAVAHSAFLTVRRHGASGHQRNDVSAFLKPAVPAEAFRNNNSFAHP